MSVTWITPDDDAVKERLANPYFEEVEQAALADGQSSPWSGLIAGVVSHFRGVIDVHFRISETANTIPPSAKRHALSVVIWDALNRFGLDHLLSDSRRKDYDAAMRWLEKVAAGSISVESPADPTDEAPAIEGGFEFADVGNSTKRKANRSRTDGLI